MVSPKCELCNGIIHADHPRYMVSRLGWTSAYDICSGCFAINGPFIVLNCEVACSKCDYAWVWEMGTTRATCSKCAGIPPVPDVVIN